MEENGDITADDAPEAEESSELAEFPVAEEKPVQQIPLKIKQGKCLSLEIGGWSHLMIIKRIENTTNCKIIFKLLLEFF